MSPDLMFFLVFGDVTRSGRSPLANQELNENHLILRRKQKMIRRKLIEHFVPYDSLLGEDKNYK